VVMLFSRLWTRRLTSSPSPHVLHPFHMICTHAIQKDLIQASCIVGPNMSDPHIRKRRRSRYWALVRRVSPRKRTPVWAGSTALSFTAQANSVLISSIRSTWHSSAQRKSVNLHAQRGIYSAHGVGYQVHGVDTALYLFALRILDSSLPSPLSFLHCDKV
jgi:hypothetical protein